MNVEQQLLHFVVRNFYDFKHVLIIDAIIIHSVLSDENLAKICVIPRKEIRQLCAKLRDDNLLVEHVKKEEGPFQRPTHKTYYYIRYTEAIDSIKWRMYSVESRLKREMGQNEHPHGYICPTCKNKYTPLEALANISSDGTVFNCTVCNDVLQEEENDIDVQASREKLGNFMYQVASILDALKKIDNMIISDNSFESSLKMAIPIYEPKLHNKDIHKSTSINSSKKSLSSKLLSSNSTSLGIPSLNVDITTDARLSAQDKIAIENKMKIANQNALPSWHTDSSISNSSSQILGQPQSSNINTNLPTTEVDNKNNFEEIAEDDDTKDAISAYYAKLKSIRDKEDAEEDEDENNNNINYNEIKVKNEHENDNIKIENNHNLNLSKIKQEPLNTDISIKKESSPSDKSNQDLLQVQDDDEDDEDDEGFEDV